jgi:hypothetical protein
VQGSGHMVSWFVNAQVHQRLGSSLPGSQPNAGRQEFTHRFELNIGTASMQHIPARHLGGELIPEPERNRRCLLRRRAYVPAGALADGDLETHPLSSVGPDLRLTALMGCPATFTTWLRAVARKHRRRSRLIVGNRE